MTDGGAAFQPGRGEPPPFRLRGAYVGHEVFGHGAGAVLVDPEVARDLRSAAESASQERRIAGGLLYGRVWADDEGSYLVVDGFLEAGPGENPGDGITREGRDSFTLLDTDLRLLREDAARMYSAFLEVGWWRTLPALGEFGPQDFETQAELAGSDSVGLLVYGSGIHWGTAYLGPEGRAPDSAGTLVASPGPVPEPALEAELAPPEPEVVDIAAGETLIPEPEPEPLPGGAGPTGEWPPTAVPRRRVRRRAAVPVAATSRRWTARRAPMRDSGPALPGDVQFVVGALVVVTVAAAIIVGVLVHSVLVALIIAVVGFVVITSSVWLSRR